MAAVMYYDVILKPVVSESSMTAMAQNKYTFLVVPTGTKTQVKEDVEKMFPGTKVASVNTAKHDGKTRRRGYTFGETAKVKKAVVTLTKDSKAIEIFSGL